MDETLSILSKEAEVNQKISIQYPDLSILYSAQLGPVLQQDPELWLQGLCSRSNCRLPGHGVRLRHQPTQRLDDEQGDNLK